MDLEQRVKTLELELKILKNEIQRVLLDVHEQVLVHYYPSLRQEGLQPPESVVLEVDALRSRARFVEPAPALPVVKKVSLGEIRASQSDPVPAPSGGGSPLSGPSTYQTTMVKMSEWASQTSAKIGALRAAELVRIFSSRGILNPETSAILLRLLSLDKNPNPDKTIVSELIAILLKLDEMVGRAVDLEELMSVIEEASFG